MAYRLHSFAWMHAAAQAGIGSIATVDESTRTPVVATTGFPTDRLLDSRHNTLAKYPSTTNLCIEVDLGADFDTVDRVLIPPGHNLESASTLSVQQDDNDSFSSPTASGGTVPVAGWNEFAFNNHTERYVRIRVVGTGAWEIPQIWFTSKQTLTTGMATPWTDQKLPQNITVPLPERDATAILAPPRTLFELIHRYTDATDVGIYDGLVTATSGGGTPFIFWPPDDARDPLLMRMARDPIREQEAVNPSGNPGNRYRVSISMVEQS